MKIAKNIICIILILIIAINAVFSVSAVENYLAKGVDVSYWQSSVDFEKVKKDGIDFAILRVGTSGGKDSTFENNYKNALAAGIDVGCYFYTYATNVQTAVSEAKKVVEWIGDKKLQYPVYFDIEDSSLESLTNRQRTDICIAFCDEINRSGFLAGIYANSYWLGYLLNRSELEKYEMWLARWTNSGNPDVDRSEECRLWQYSSTGKVAGVVSDVDMNVSYFDYPAYVKENGLNNYPKPENPSSPDTPNFSEKFKVIKSWYRIFLEIIKIIIRTV